MRVFYVSIIGMIVLLIGCSSADSKYSGWESVKIEQVPSSSQCEYVSQQVCYPWNAHEGCANFHKKKAAQDNANTVVIDRTNSTGDGGILANYYLCK